MYLKKSVLLVLAWCTYHIVSGQEACTSVFTGKILDAHNHPVIGAAVVIMPQQLGQVSDSLGNFRFTGLCVGKYTLKVQHIGYKEVVNDLVIKGRVHRTIRLTEEVTELHEIVVLHHDEARTEHATNFVQLSERKLSELAGRSLGESLREIPGVSTIQTGPGIFKPVIHGVHSQRILILNNGIRQESQQWGAEHAPEIDPFIASNVVIIKDASAIKFGPDALGGVIVINPPELPEQAGLAGQVSSVLQSNGRSGTFSGMLEGGIKGGEGWGWRVQGTARRAGDFSTPGYHLTNTGIEEINFSVATGFHKEHAGFDIFFSRFQTELGILKGTSIGSMEDLRNVMKRDVPDYTTDFSYVIGEPRQEAIHNLLKLNGHVETSGGEWRLQYGFQRNERREFDMRRGDLSLIPLLDLSLFTHSIDVEWETHHSSKRTLSFGVNGLYQNNNNVPGTNRIPFIPNFNNSSAGLFTVAKFYLDSWTVNAGARYDFRNYSVKGFDFKNTFYEAAFNFDNISGSLGVAREWKSRHRLSLNVSRAWRPPHVAELYSLGTHQSVAAIEYGVLLHDPTNEVMDIKQTGIKPERALKTVATYQFSSQSFSLNVSPYVNYIVDYIFLRPRGVTETLRGVYPYFRYAQTDALFMGMDLSASWKTLKYLEVTPQVSLLRVADRVHSDYFIFIPSNRYKMEVRYQRPAFGLRNVYIESGAQYVAKQNRAPRVVTIDEIIAAEEQGVDLFESDNTMFDFMPAPDAYLLWDISVGCTVKGRVVQYDLRMASENVLNTAYREYTNRLRYYADEAGRNFILSLKCIF